MKSENKHGTHLWAMIACCAVMLLAVLAFTSTETGIGFYGYLLFLLCPVMHLAMCKWTHGAHDPRKDGAPRRLPSVADETDRGRT
jgi:amino acid transporter